MLLCTILISNIILILLFIILYTFLKKKNIYDSEIVFIYFFEMNTVFNLNVC